MTGKPASRGAKEPWMPGARFFYVSQQEMDFYRWEHWLQGHTGEAGNGGGNEPTGDVGKSPYKRMRNRPDAGDAKHANLLGR
jgi:hypothetical protein